MAQPKRSTRPSKDNLNATANDNQDDFDSADEYQAIATESVQTTSSVRTRLNKLIADSGLVSRRKADRMIEEGRVLVNGKKVFEMGIKIDLQNDKVVIDGKPLRRKFEHIYIMFHKPRGVLTTMFDPMDRPIVKDFLGEVPARVFPVGRLDWDSEGLLLLTNDGDYANQIMHPKEEVTKTYLVKVDKEPRPDQLQKLLVGVPIVGGRVKAKHIEAVPRGSGEKPWLKIIISEGKNRQIRQMFEKIGMDVIKLQRVAVGRLRIGALKRGELVYLNETAAQRVFMADEPETVKFKKSYKSAKTPSSKRQTRSASKMSADGTHRPSVRNIDRSRPAQV